MCITRTSYLGIQNSGKNILVFNTHILEFVAAKFNLNLAFVQFITEFIFLITKNKNLYSLHYQNDLSQH